MLTARELEIRRNYAYFKDLITDAMVEHAGETALIHKCSVVDYFATASEAVRAGMEQFGVLPFSIQRVVDRPIDLGFLSHATDNGDSL